MIDDDGIQQVIGINTTERDQLRQHRDVLAQRPAWLDQWITVLSTNDIKPDNFGFRDGRPDQPVFLDFGAARLAPMEEELTLMLDRLEVDHIMRDDILTTYLNHLAQAGGPKIHINDLLRRLPWAMPVLLLRSLIEQADALRWVPHQDRSKGFIHHVIHSVGEQLAHCPR